MAPKEEEEKQEEILDETTGAALVEDDKVAENDVEKGDSDNLEEVEMASGNEGGDNEKEDGEEKKVSVVSADAPWSQRMWEVFTTFWPLGLVAFGGPQAHVAILRDHLVEQRGWMDEEQFTELFAIGQGLPGPTSTQLVVSTALSRAGPLGGLMAFFLWNLPGLIVLTLCGILIETYVDPNNPPW
jgi:chromate transporter